MKHAFRLAILFVAFTAFAQKPTRLSWQEFAKDPQRVQSFRNAVATMRERNTADPTSTTFRRSWTYWGSMHGFFGAESPRIMITAERREKNTGV